MRHTLILIWLYLSLGADDLILPPIVLDAIKNSECLQEEGICNPYFIRINKKTDISKAKTLGLKMSYPYIHKCSNESLCELSAKKLIANGIHNIDMGPYQINYFYHPTEKLSEYFEFESAKLHAQKILSNLINKYGYNWVTLGRYHHYDPNNTTRNRNYYTKLYKYIYGI